MKDHENRVFVVRLVFSQNGQSSKIRQFASIIQADHVSARPVVKHRVGANADLETRGAYIRSTHLTNANSR
jgi:hypothetical protein